MKKYFASLLFLLSGAAFLNSPALSMRGEVDEASTQDRRVSPYRDPLVKLKVDFDALVGTFNSLRQQGNKTPNTELVGYLLGPENWRSLPRFHQQHLVGGVVKRARDREREEHIRKVASGYHAVRPTNNASDEEIVGYLFGSAQWEKISHDKQWRVVEEVIRKARALEIGGIIKESGVLEKYRATRASGNKASDVNLISYLLGTAKWEQLEPNIQREIIDNVRDTSNEMDRDAIFPLIRSGKLENAFEAIKTSTHSSLSDEEVVKQALANLGFKDWERLSEDSPSFLVKAVGEKDPVILLHVFTDEEKSKAEITKSYHSMKDVNPDASDEEVVKTVLRKMGYKYWDRLTGRDQRQIISDTVQRAEADLIPEWIRNARPYFDERELAILFTDDMRERDRKSIIRAARKVADDEIASRVAVIAENMPKIFTKDMGRKERSWIIGMALGLKITDRALANRINAISNNADKLFFGINDHKRRAYLTWELLWKDSSEINAIAAQAHTLYLPYADVEAQMRAIDYFLLPKPVPAQLIPVFPQGTSIPAIPAQMIPVSPQMVPMPSMSKPVIIEGSHGDEAVKGHFMDSKSRDDDRALIADLTKSAGEVYRSAIQENIHKVFTSSMKKVAKRTIIQAALKIEAEEIGPRVEAISRNASLLFKGINNNNHRALLTEALLTRYPGEIESLAKDADTLYLNRKDKKAQVSIIKQAFFIPGD